jgi:predicted dehydrogenase
VRVAVLSFWHVHAHDYAGEAVADPRVELAAVWDDDAARGRAAAARYGAPFVAGLDDVLGDDGIDAVVVTTATRDHREVIAAAARAGKHVFTEKVIAATVADTDTVLAATRAAGIAFAVSLPRLDAPYAAATRQVLAEGRLGDVSLARVRIGHDGAVRTPEHPHGWLPARFFDPAEAQGGALIDLGCHPLYLVHSFLGTPDRVVAVGGQLTGRAVEDHAVALFAYRSGAVGQAEVSFVTPPHFRIEVFGTAGTLRYDDAHGLLLVSDEPVPLPAAPPTPFQRWVGQIRDGSRDLDDLAAARDLSVAVERCYDTWTSPGQ